MAIIALFLILESFIFKYNVDYRFFIEIISWVEKVHFYTWFAEFFLKIKNVEFSSDASISIEMTICCFFFRLLT